MAKNHKNAPVCATTRRGADFRDVMLGVIVGVVTHGGAEIRVKPTFDADGAIVSLVVVVDGAGADVVYTHADGSTEMVPHRYSAGTPRRTAAKYPKLVVHGRTRKNVSYPFGHFDRHGPADNTAARQIATVRVTDAVVRMHDGTEHTLNGVWTIMAMVKTLTDGSGRLATVHAAPGETLVVNCVNN